MQRNSPPFAYALPHHPTNNAPPPWRATASIAASGWTHTTQRRYAALKDKHPKVAPTTKGYFNRNAPAAKVTMLTEGEYFASFSVVTGTGPLNAKLRTIFGGVRATLEDEQDDTAPGVDVVLGSTSNRADRTQPAYFLEEEVGKVHAVLLLAKDVPDERRADFPHGPPFTKTDAPALAKFFAAGAKNEKHVVALPPVAHPNSWDADDPPAGKITDDAVQAFGDGHGGRGAHWLVASKAWRADVMKVVLDKKDDLKAHLPPITASRMLNARPKLVSVDDDLEDRLVDGLDKYERRLQRLVEAVTANSMPDVIGVDSPSVAGVGGALGVATPTEDTATKAEREKKELLHKLEAIFAHVDGEGNVQPPVLSEGGKLLLSITNARERARAYASSALDLLNHHASAAKTHYLGRAASLPPNGYSDYCATCFATGTYRLHALQSFAQAKNNKTGACILFHIPPRENTKTVDDDDVQENAGRTIDELMGEAKEKTDRLKKELKVNDDFGSFEDCLILLGNLWLQQQVFFEPEPKSALTLFAELLGDAICQPEVKRWLRRNEHSTPENAFAIFNACEQAYLHATKMVEKRTELRLVAAANWEAVCPDPYTDIGDLATDFVRKLLSASVDGDAFVRTPVCASSRRVALLKRQEAETARALRRLDQKREAAETAREDPKRTRRERERNNTDPPANKPVASEADKRGDIIAAGYVDCPVVPGDTQPCGAFYRQGVACSKFVKTGKCGKDHTPIDNLPAAARECWRVKVDATDGVDFNPASVTSLKKSTANGSMRKY